MYHTVVRATRTSNNQDFKHPWLIKTEYSYGMSAYILYTLWAVQ